MIFIFMIINGFIRLQIEVVFFISVVGFTIVGVHRFNDDSDRNGMKQYMNRSYNKIQFSKKSFSVEL